MKALTLWQPYATAIARGWKRVETRPPWAMRLGKLVGTDLAIHAAVREVPLAALRAYGHVTIGRPRGCSASARYFSPALHGDVVVPLPLGCVVAVARIAAVMPMVPLEYQAQLADEQYVIDVPEQGGLHARLCWGEYELIEDQRPWGDFAPGRVAVLLDHVRPLANPVAMRGAQQLWTLNSVAEAMVNVELSLAEARRARDEAP